MRKTTELFLIDGLPMLAPDENMEISLEDVEASDSGRDESGFLHRFMLRQGVGKWKFSYARLTQQEYAYMESLFAGKSAFRFAYPRCADGQQEEITAYRSKHEVRWQSAKTCGLCDYSFYIIGC